MSTISPQRGDRGRAVSAQPKRETALPHRCKSCRTPIRFRNGMCPLCTAAVIRQAQADRTTPTVRDPAFAADDLDPVVASKSDRGGVR